MIEWKNANGRKMQCSAGTSNMNAKKNQVMWQPQGPGCFKLNVDASLESCDKTYALVIVIRDDQ